MTFMPRCTTCGVKSCKYCVQCNCPLPVELAGFATEPLPPASPSTQPCHTTVQNNALDIPKSELTSYPASRESPSTASTPSAQSEWRHQQQEMTQPMANEARACNAGAPRPQQEATTCEHVAYFIGSSPSDTAASTPHREEEVCAQRCSSHDGSPEASDTGSTNFVDDAANFITCQLHFAEPSLSAGAATPDSTSQGTAAENHEIQCLISHTVSNATSFCKQLQHEPGNTHNTTSDSEMSNTTWPITADAVTTAQQITADTQTGTTCQASQQHDAERSNEMLMTAFNSSCCLRSMFGLNRHPRRTKHFPTCLRQHSTCHLQRTTPPMKYRIGPSCFAPSLTGCLLTTSTPNSRLQHTTGRRGVRIFIQLLFPTAPRKRRKHNHSHSLSSTTSTTCVTYATPIGGAISVHTVFAFVCIAARQQTRTHVP